MKKKKLFVTTALSVVAAFAMSAVAMPLTYVSAASSGKVTMYRLYNPNSGEHLYTNALSEKNTLTGAGWKYEGEGWIAPEKSNTPVYRLYNPNSGEHHYTVKADEKEMLVNLGWNDEGIGWYSDDSQGTPLYRLYNPNATGQYEAGAHHYTKDINEKNTLIISGWNDEGIGWYGLSKEASQDDTVLNSISLSQTIVDLDIGKTTTLKVKYSPTTYSGDKTVTWTSSKTSVAKVDSNGVVTAVSEGTATITASVNGKTANCTVNVYDPTTKSGFQKVKEYVMTSGKKESDHYIYVKNYPTYNMGISYYPSSNMLIFVDASKGSSTKNEYRAMSILPNSEQVDVFDTWDYPDGVSFRVYAYAIKSSIKGRNDNLYFSYFDGDKQRYYAAGILNVSKESNTSLTLSFITWNSWLEEEVGTNLKELGVSSYVL